MSKFEKRTYGEPTIQSNSDEDCISRSHFDERVRVAGGMVEYELSDDFKDGVLTVLEMLKTEPSIQPKTKTEWISVSERLPKADEYIGDVAKYYLVQNEYGDMLVARYTHSEYWEQMYQLKPIADEIVAWMPLPKPYKAESEDKE